MIVVQFFWHVIAPPRLRNTLALAGIGKSLVKAGCEHQAALPLHSYGQALQNPADSEPLLRLEVHAVQVEMIV